MLVLGGIATGIAGIVGSNEGFPLAVLMLWAVALVIAGLVRPPPEQTVHRGMAMFAAAISSFVLAFQAMQIGGVGTQPSVILMLLPVLYLVVVPDDVVVAITCSLSSIACGAGMGLLLDSPPGFQEWFIQLILVSGMAISASVYYGRERRDLLERERERARALEDLAISERLRAQAELVAATGRTAADIGHEINNPLTYVLANIELAQEAVPHTHDRQDLVELLEDALTGAVRIRDLVQDLKASAQPARAPQPLRLSDVLESAIRMSWNEIRHRARLERDYRAAPWVWGAETRLSQVFVNLLVNAAQAIPEGDSAHRITVTIDASEGVSRVQIQDDGPGISPTSLPHIFDAFYTTKGSRGGSGLGLAVCRQVVESFGGAISVESDLGAGTVFTVTLPRVEAPPPSEAPTSPTPLSARGGRILVIDDELLVRRTVERIISPWHDVESFGSATEALDRLTREPPVDLILCDLMMPGLSGPAFFRQLQERQPELCGRVLFMTGGAITEDGRKFFADLPPARRVEKPLDPTELRSLIAQRLSAPAQTSAAPPD